MTTASVDDLNMARQWVRQLDEWVRANGLKGYDPFDVRAHPALIAMQRHFLPRRITNLALDAFPAAFRRVLHIRPVRNPEAFALVAMARLRLYELTSAEEYLKSAREDLEWLHERARTDGPGMSWGHPFEMSAPGTYRPAGIPITVITALAGEAFAKAYKIAGDSAYLESCRMIAEFFVHGLNRIDGGDGTFCYSYSSVDQLPVHHANLHAVAHLYRTHELTNNPEWLQQASPALEYSLRRQKQDGSWPYGEFEPAAGRETSLMETVAHHHTGFILRCLYEIQQLAPNEQIKTSMLKGYDFYQRRLFGPHGVPCTNTTSAWPVDIHACAEAILCPATYSDTVSGAMRRAVDSLQWTWHNLADKKTGLPYYRKYPFFTNRLLCTRWGLAWMMRALAEFLYVNR